ncbi:MAG: sodium:calcium antiporter [Chitinophagaceae bacterium]
MLHISGFLACATVIFFAGKRLAHYGDLLAEKTGMSRGWIGLILMASVTSLPELMVGISSSAIVKSADLAVGDIMGSSAFNLMILAVLDAFIPKQQPLFGIASPNHMLNAGLGIILITLVGFALFLPQDYPVSPYIGLSSIIFVVVYFISIRMIYKNEQTHRSPFVLSEQEKEPGTPLSVRRIILWYALFAGVIILAALALPYFANQIAEDTGLGKSFVGTFFLAVSTSLPEIAVSIAAVRMGSIDLAVGNLLGSNIFNVLILAIDDLVYPNGLILKDASDFLLISVFSTILMSAIVIIGLSFRAKGKRYFLAWDAAAIFLIYIVNLLFLYHFSS